MKTHYLFTSLLGFQPNLDFCALVNTRYTGKHILHSRNGHQHVSAPVALSSFLSINDIFFQPDFTLHVFNRNW